MGEKKKGSPLSLLIDARKLGHGGIGVYVQNLLKGLIQAKQEGVPLILSALCQPGVQTGFSKDIDEIIEPAPLYSMKEMFLLGRKISKMNVDLFHTPHYTLPYGLSVPSVMTLHDVIHVSHPERWYYPIVASHLIKNAAKRATKIIAVSHATKHDLSFIVSDSSSIMKKVSVVPNAFDLGVAAETLSSSELRRTFRLFHPFALAVVSTDKAHKGVVDLLSAWREVRKLDTTCELVIVGQGAAKAISSSRELGIHVLGNVSDEILFALYRACYFLIVPSRAEGFCLPALQAKSCGAPIVVRPVPALKELVTSSDIMADDFSISALSNAILKAVQGGVTSGIPHAKAEDFTVSNVTKKILAVYSQALNDNRLAENVPIESEAALSVISGSRQ